MDKLNAVIVDADKLLELSDQLNVNIPVPAFPVNELILFSRPYDVSVNVFSS